MRNDLAIALGYEMESDPAPRVLAAGKGEIARRIRRLAEEAGVPLREDGDLVELLIQIPLKEEIPAELYPAVAEVFAFLYLIGKRRGELD